MYIQMRLNKYMYTYVHIHSIYIHYTYVHTYTSRWDMDTIESFTLPTVLSRTNSSHCMYNLTIKSSYERKDITDKTNFS